MCSTKDREPPKLGANPSIERTVNSQLRCLSPAAPVKRWAS